VRGTLRRHLPSVVALVLAISIVPVGLLDHRYKQSRMDAAEVGEWYCMHLETRCHGASSAGIEANWNRREAAYLGLLLALTTFATLRLALRTPAGASRPPTGVVRRSSS
jgi:hypothetical protein